MNKGIVISVITGLTIGIIFIIAVTLIMPVLPYAASITSENIELGTKQIALDRRADTDAMQLNAVEIKIVQTALSEPAVLRVLQQADSLYVHSIEYGEAFSREYECNNDCAKVIFSWDLPVKGSLLIAVDVDDSAVTFWARD